MSVVVFSTCHYLNKEARGQLDLLQNIIIIIITLVIIPFLHSTKN
jgi:hypothetical protein